MLFEFYSKYAKFVFYMYNKSFLITLSDQTTLIKKIKFGDVLC